MSSDADSRAVNGKEIESLSIERPLSFSPPNKVGGDEVPTDEVLTPNTPGSETSRSTFGYFKERYSDMKKYMNKSSINVKEEFFPWANVLVISGVIGCVEYIPFLLLGWAIPLRLHWLDNLYDDYGLYAQVLSAIGSSIGLVCIAVTAVVLAPAAQASGLPPIIAYLSNGKMINPDHFSVKTIFAKIISVCSAISGGLTIGREGPAIHIGAALGDLCYRALTKITEWWIGDAIPFDGTVRANVVMMGSAAGFSSAFRAPLGGFFYILEELAVHWNIQEHTTTGSQIFLAVAFGTFVTSAIVRATQDTGTVSFSSIIIFDDSTAEVYADTWKYNDIPILLIMSCVTGVFGGYYTRAAIFINSLRKNWAFYKENVWMKYLDGALVATIVTSTLCLLPVIYTKCHANPDYGDDDHRRLASTSSSRNYVQHSCDYSYFSEMASLSLSGEEAVIRHLLSRDNVYFAYPTLFVFLIFYTPLTLLVMGLPVAAGTFVPNLLLGSLLGRIVGKLAKYYVFTGENDISHAGVYALIGAGALLGAWTRTMTAVVITIIEISGDVAIVVPLIVCVVVSRAIANKIAHHSYTHDSFYKLIDKDGESSNPFLHPGDWVPIEEVKEGNKSFFVRKRRSTLTKTEETEKENSLVVKFDAVAMDGDGDDVDADALNKGEKAI